MVTLSFMAEGKLWGKPLRLHPPTVSHPDCNLIDHANPFLIAQLNW